MNIIKIILLIISSYIINIIGILISIYLNIYIYINISNKNNEIKMQLDSYNGYNSETIAFMPHYFYILWIVFSGLLFSILIVPILLLFWHNIRIVVLILLSATQLWMVSEFWEPDGNVVTRTAIGMIPTYIAFIISMFFQPYLHKKFIP